MTIQQNLKNGEITLGKQRIALHCNYYNIYLQKTLEDGLGEEMREIQVSSAYEITKTMFQEVLSDLTKEEQLVKATELFQEMGLGKLDFSQFDNGKGPIIMPRSHYALACFSQFGPSKNSVCLFPKGYIMAILTELLDILVTTETLIETNCMAFDPEKVPSCIFEVKQ